MQKDMISVKIQNANGAFLYVAQRFSVIKPFKIITCFFLKKWASGYNNHQSF